MGLKLHLSYIKFIYIQMLLESLFCFIHLFVFSCIDTVIFFKACVALLFWYTRFDEVVKSPNCSYSKIIDLPNVFFFKLNFSIVNLTNFRL